MSNKKKALPLSKKSNVRLFYLERQVDESGVSGAGRVAEGVEFSNGLCAITWLGQYRCSNVYENIKSVEAIHGHEGSTKVVFVHDDVYLKVIP